MKIPPSLRNIYKEIKAEYAIEMPPHGDLTAWAEQGVLLLNATLTVRQASPGSHQRKGWEEFTDAVIRAVNEKRDHVVFLLWGPYAQQKTRADRRQQTSGAGSITPFTAFARVTASFGSGHFKKANEFLIRTRT